MANQADASIEPLFRHTCACGIYTQVQATSIGEAKMKFRAKGLKLIGEAHNLRWACARCASVEERHAA